MKEIVIQEIFRKMISRFKYFGINWKNRKWSLVFNIFFITFFKNWNNFCNIKFVKKNVFFQGFLKNALQSWRRQ